MHHLSKTLCSSSVSAINVRRLLFSTSQRNNLDRELEEDAKWAKSAEAKETFSFLSQSSNDETKYPRIIADNMTSYITKRLNRVPGHHELRVLSDLLTFPLSLSMAVQSMLPAPFVQEVEELNILVVGARAESSLPLVWWQEALRLQLPNSSTHSDSDNNSRSSDGRQTKSSHRRWKIHMIGPGIQTVIPSPATTSKGRVGVYLSPYSPADRHLLQDHPQVLSLLRSAHLVVLFHPGLGSPAFSKGWGRAVREMLIPCRKPLFLTALHAQDMHRDLTALKQMTAEDSQGGGAPSEDGESWESLLRPGNNPFASRRPRPLSMDGDQIKASNSASHGSDSDSKQEVVISNSQVCGLLPK